MTLPYYLRLLCLCLSAFFVVHALAWLGGRALAVGAVRVAGTMRPDTASRFLFAVRLAPVAVALFFVVGFCVPSYLWLEPQLPDERVGWFCLGAAVLGATAWLTSLARGLTAVVRTERYLRNCASDFDGTTGMFVLPESSAVMAVAGVVHPRLVVSQGVLDALNAEEQDAAFRHEVAHRMSRDNIKKLFFLLAPDIVPFVRSMGSLERAWATFTEWAADDHAVDGNQERAISLATALVKVAKLRAIPVPACLMSSLMDDSRDLEARVNRLLCRPAYVERPLAPVVGFLRGAAMVIGSVTVTVLLWPESLGGVHRLLERMVQ